MLKRRQHFSEFRVTTCIILQSNVGRKVQYYCERVGRCLLDVINSCKQRKLEDYAIVCRAGMIQQLVMVTGGLLCMSRDNFTHNNVLNLIVYLSVDLVLMFFIYFVYVHLVYDFCIK